MRTKHYTLDRWQRVSAPSPPHPPRTAPGRRPPIRLRKPLPAWSVIIIDLNDDPSDSYGIISYTCIIRSARDSTALFFGRPVERIPARITRHSPANQSMRSVRTDLSPCAFFIPSLYARVCVCVRVCLPANAIYYYYYYCLCVYCMCVWVCGCRCRSGYRL